MNEVIKLILNHRSIRHFKKDKLSNKQITTIIKSAQRAATSSFTMPYTIIGVTDELIKSKISKLAGTSFVEDCGVLFVFCGDLNRNYNQLSNTEQIKAKQMFESTEHFMVMNIDAALAAQNATLAAESMGLGCCYLGNLRNNIKDLDKLLKLPDYVIPLFGLAVGYPSNYSGLKPRLPLEVMYHENTYLDIQKQQEEIKKFNKEINNNYYKTRPRNPRDDNWTNQIKRKYTNTARLNVGVYVNKKKLNKQ